MHILYKLSLNNQLLRSSIYVFRLQSIVHLNFVFIDRGTASLFDIWIEEQLKSKILKKKFQQSEQINTKIKINNSKVINSKNFSLKII